MPLARTELFRVLEYGLYSDGAIGTELIRLGVSPSDILRANVEHPSLVAEIHKSYFCVNILTANTFGLPDGPDWQEHIQAGLRLVIEAAESSNSDTGAWVSLIAQLVVQERAFFEGLAREAQSEDCAVLIETCARLDEAVEAIRVLRQSGYDSLLAVTCHFQAEGIMPDGSKPETVALALLRAGADIVGGNCGDEPEMFVPIAAQMRQVTSAPLLFQPNAGLLHRDMHGNQAYSIGPEEFAISCSKLYEVGVDILGGCCGTTPEHIWQLMIHTAQFGRSEV